MKKSTSDHDQEIACDACGDIRFKRKSVVSPVRVLVAKDATAVIESKLSLMRIDALHRSRELGNLLDNRTADGC
jgi:hypothetical protein